jgi:sialate O-acetylesterase
MSSRFLTALGAVLVMLVSLLPAPRAVADVRLPSIIGDNMVLQHGRKAPLWGWAQPGEEVTVTLDGARCASAAGADGRWKLDLPPHQPGGSLEMTVAGRNTIKIKNVVFGEVWVCSGQSNMAWGVAGSATGAEIAKMDYPNVRSFQMDTRPREAPLSDCIGGWRPANPKTVGEISAVGFWFALKLHQALKIPVGLINATRGATWAEAWTQREVLAADADYQPIFDRQRQFLAGWPRRKAEMEAALAKWKTEAEAARSRGRPEPPRPFEPRDEYDYHYQNFPGYMFNGGIAPVLPYGIRGAIWYQGEGNSGRAYQYRKLLPAMIGNWRALWGQGDFPFLIVQLPNYMKVQPEPGESQWAELREAQLLVSKAVKQTGIAVTIDLGDPVDVHPRNKWDIGKRLALVALGTVYGQPIEYSGPALDHASFQGQKVVLGFQHAAGGLAAGKDGSNGPLRGFAVAGSDRKFQWADARIDGNTVIVSSAKVAKPIAVRYAWANNPACNLYNKAGLPASPFRTDDWPGCTINNK